MSRPLRLRIRRLALLFVVFVPLSFFVGSGCSSSNGALRNARSAAKQGNYETAARRYAEVLRQEGENTDARSALKSAAQNHLDTKFAAFSRQAESGEYERAYATYREAMSFREEVTRGTSVSLSVNARYRTQYQKTKEALAQKHYQEGKSALAESNYGEAVRHLQRSQTFVSSYKDTEELLNRAQNRESASEAATAYRNGKQALEAGRYRRAHELFGTVLKTKPGYKDASALRKKALKRGQIGVAIIPFTSGASAQYAQGVTDQLYSETLTSTVDLDDPFLDVVERGKLQSVLREQNITRSGAVDQTTAAEVGEILGVQAIVVGSVTDLRTNTNGPRRETREAWYTEVEDITELNFNTRKVTYSYHEASREVTLEAEYRLVEVESAEIINASSVDRSENDQIEYATFRGDHTKLLPYDVNAKNVTTGTAQALRNDAIDPSLFEGREELRPADEIANQLAESIGKQIAQSVHKALQGHQFPSQEETPALSDNQSPTSQPNRDTTEASAPEPPETQPTSKAEREVPELRTGRVTGRYLRVRGAQFYEIGSGTKVQIVDDRGRVIAKGIVTSVLRNEATVEVQSRRGFASLQEGQRVVIERE